MNAPKSALAVVAHPDDIEFCFGGTLAKWAKAGTIISYLIVTNGASGSADNNADPEQIANTRRAEQEQAAALLGAQTVIHLDYPDGFLECNQALKKDIVRHIRILKPEVVLTFDPTMVYSALYGVINHPDHRAVGQATLDAVFPLARDHLAYPDLHQTGLEPHKTATILLANYNLPNYFIDITDSFETKVTAMTTHVSQVAAADKLRIQLETMARDCGGQSGYDLAEGFVKIEILP